MEFKPLAQTFALGTINWFLILQFNLIELMRSEVLVKLPLEGELLQSVGLAFVMTLFWLFLTWLWIMLYTKFTGAKK